MKARKRLTIWILLFPFAVALALAGCGGGGGGNNSVAGLEGTWFGAYEFSGLDTTLGVDVGTNGTITDIRQSGTSLGLTGTITHEQGNIFSFTLSDGTEGGFMTDASGGHAGFLDEFGNFGVLQKSASSLPAYEDDDVVGGWSGYSLMLDSELNVTSTGASNATVSGGALPFVVSGNDMDGPFTGQINSFVPEGAYRGTWDAGPDSGGLRAWVSVDKSFAATWACDDALTPVSFTECTFAIWNKQ